jgi:competence protein ComEA
MTTTGPPAPLARWSSWLQATPAELVGLAVLLLGGLVAAALLWWGAVQRPGELPTDVVGVGTGPHGDAGGEGASGSTDGSGSSAPAGTGLEGSGALHELGDDHGAGPASSPSEHTTEVVVHVSGAVGQPGLVTLPAGARVGDAIEAAGGATDGADGTRINLARSLQDGEHVHVPREGEELPPGWEDGSGPAGGGASSSAGTGADGRLDLNRATADELETLPGIGPSKAEAIVRHREEHGPFREPGELRAVPGIGEKTFQRLAELVAVS